MLVFIKDSGNENIIVDTDRYFNLYKILIKCYRQGSYSSSPYRLQNKG